MKTLTVLLEERHEYAAVIDVPDDMTDEDARKTVQRLRREGELKVNLMDVEFERARVAPKGGPCPTRKSDYSPETFCAAHDYIIYPGSTQCWQAREIERAVPL